MFASYTKMSLAYLISLLISSLETHPFSIRYALRISRSIPPYVKTRLDSNGLAGGGLTLVHFLSSIGYLSVSGINFFNLDSLNLGLLGFIDKK